MNIPNTNETRKVGERYANLFLSLHNTLLSANSLDELLNTLGEGLKGIVNIAGINLVFKDDVTGPTQIHRCFTDTPPPEGACQYISQISRQVFQDKSPLELTRKELGDLMGSGIVYPLFFHGQVEAAMGFFCTQPIKVLRERLSGIEELLPELGLIVGGYRLWWEKEKRRRQWEAALEALEDAVFLADLQSNRISYANRAAREMLGEGITAGSALPIKACKVPLLCTLCHSLKDSVVRSKTPKESRFIDKERTLSLRASPVMGEGGTVESILFILKDVTLDVKRNLNLIKAERLEAISEVLEGISHSLNNPITAVVGFAQFLLERDDIPPDAKESLKVIERESKRCSEVVNRLLTFIGSKEGEVGQVDVNSLVSNIALLRSDAMFRKKIDLDIRLDPNLKFVWGESHAIQQALVNIVLNAENAVPQEGGIIRISTRQLKETVEVVVEDNGPGVPQEIKETIFTPFFTTDITKGTGLGLSIALSAIEEQGGSIEVRDSEELGGALFRVVLPLPTAKERPTG